MTSTLKHLAIGAALAPLWLAGAAAAAGPDAAPATPAAVQAAPSAAVALQAPATPAAAPAMPSAGKDVSLAALGVELVSVNLSAADFLIDVRYRVKDPVRAQALLDRKVQPVLVNEATGDRFYVPSTPKIGALRQTSGSKQAVLVDRVYFMLFANPDRKLKAGEKVTLYAGDSIVHDIVIKH